jgi:serine/threonine-protein kinase
MSNTLEKTAVEAPAARRSVGEVTDSSDAHSRGATRESHASTGATEGKTGLATPLEALQVEEVARTRTFVQICIGIVIATGLFVTQLGGDPVARNILYAGLGTAFVVFTATLYRIRHDSSYRVALIVPFTVTFIGAAFTAVYYFGIFSAAPSVLVLGLYFFSLGASPRATIFNYALAASLQLALTLLVTQGVIADRGIIQGDGLSTFQMYLYQGLVEMMYLCAFLIGRGSRLLTLDAIAKLERAVRSVSQREALLLEARQDLDRAMRIGGPGRWTDQQFGPFVLGTLLGRGGMGEVYEARHIDSGAEAAVKLLQLHMTAETAYVARFVRETEAARSIRSPHVVRVLEVGRTESGVTYLAMERLHGHDLSHHLRKRHYIGIARVIELVRQVGAGLEAARDAGIVHRDIKPQNLFRARVEKGRIWKILDFGVSKLAHSDGTLTKGQVVGTPGYMAPEQARSQEVDHRADLYSLGAIAYRALTGHPPFSGKDLPTTLYDVAYKMPTRPSTHRPSLTAHLDLVLAIAIAKKPEDRFESATELADALDAASVAALSKNYIDRANALLDDLAWGARR